MSNIGGFEPEFSENGSVHSGPPTREEMLVHYPAKFTWTQLKTFVNSGNLGLVKRDKNLQLRYLANLKEIETQYGSVVDYLLNYRLQWGKPDRLSLLRSALDVSAELSNTCGRISNASQVSEDSVAEHSDANALPPTQEGLLYFKADTPPELISIIMCDWPYSVPLEIEHALIWTRLPILPPSLPSADDCPLSARLHQYGLWGFTGLSSPPPPPSMLPACLPALSEWGVTLEDLTAAPPMTAEEQCGVRSYGAEIEKFIKRRWVEQEWETAWFVHPPRLQSVPGLAHIHVFAKHKTSEDNSCDKE